MLDAWDKKSGEMLAVYARMRGPSDNYQVDAMLAWLKHLGWHKLMLRPDGEPALVAVMEKVKQRRVEPTIMHEPPEESPEESPEPPPEESPGPPPEPASRRTARGRWR